MLWLLPILLRHGISDRLAKPLAWVANVAIALAIVVGCILILRSVARSHDAAVATNAVSIHDKDLSIEAYNMVVSAGDAATVNQMARDDIAANNAKEIDREAAKGDASAVGPGVSGVLARMRDQQAAGRR